MQTLISFWYTVDAIFNNIDATLKNIYCSGLRYWRSGSV